jgi:hypothetical protein
MLDLDLDGSDLMAKVFSHTAPQVLLGDQTTETERNIQAGFRFMFMGAVRGIAIPRARAVPTSERRRGTGEARVAGMLMRHLDAATITAEKAARG